MTTVITTLLVLVLVAVAVRYARQREASSTVVKKPKRVLSFTTSQEIDHVLQAIIRSVEESEYGLETTDDENPRLILGTPPTATTWGFFYPVYLTRQDDGQTLIEVGIQSRLFQAGPIVRKHHARCFGLITEAVLGDGRSLSGAVDR